MTNIVEMLLSRNLVDVFGEPDALKRRVAIAEIWTTNGVFAEPNNRRVGQEAGAVGGGVGGQILNAILGLGGTMAASGLDIGSIVSGFATGGVSGAVTALIIGFIKSKMSS